MTYDDLLKQVNKKPFLWRCFGIYFVNGFPNALSITSLALLFFVPKHFHCSFPNDAADYLENNPSALNASLTLFIPYDNEEKDFSKCSIYNRSAEDIWNFIHNFTSINHTTASKTKLINTSCDGKYDFGKNPQIKSASMELSNSARELLGMTATSTLSERLFRHGGVLYSAKRANLGVQTFAILILFGYLCSGSWVKPLIILIYFCSKITTSLAGILSDKFGRRPVFIYSTFLLFLAMFFQSFSNSTWLFAAVAAIQGLASASNYYIGFILGVEYTLPENRNFISISSFLSFSLGYGLTSLVGFLTPNWRWFYRVTSFFGFFYVLNFWLIYESPRWLLSNGRIKEAKRVFEKMAKTNNESFPLELFEKMEEKGTNLLKKNEEKPVEKLKMRKIFMEICRMPKMLLVVFVLSYSWFAIAIIYYGISLNVQSLAGNIYLNNTLMGLVEIPGLILAYVGVKYLNRSICHGGSVIFCAVCCIAAALLDKEHPVVSAAAALIGKSIISGSYYLVFIHVTEVFPTVVRSSYMTILAAVGTIGMVVSPYIVYLGDIYGQYTPYLMMGILTISSGLATLFLVPNTNNVELPEATEDVIKMKTLASCFYLKKKKNSSLNDEEKLTTIDRPAVRL